MTWVGIDVVLILFEGELKFQTVNITDAECIEHSQLVLMVAQMAVSVS